MSHQTSKISLFILLAALLSWGCNQNVELPATHTSSSARLLSADPIQVNTVEASSMSQTKAVKVSPLEYAQKEYLNAYNEYVRLLRESGPQTIETLHALALYQNKYQLYQMLLKDEGDGKNL